MWNILQRDLFNYDWLYCIINILDHHGYLKVTNVAYLTGYRDALKKQQQALSKVYRGHRTAIDTFPVFIRFAV